MRPEDIPEPTIRRLSLYLRYLEDCHSRDERTISSKRLGRQLGLSDAQVRKDLAHFGPSGHPGIGYRVADLIQRIRQILGTDRAWSVILVGAGNLGRALSAYRGFVHKGFELVAVFDVDSGKVGKPLPGAPHLAVRPFSTLTDTVGEQSIKLGILAVPASCAQQVAEQMVAAGIKGILNFAPTALILPSEISVVDIDLAVQLEQLSFRVRGLSSGALDAENSGPWSS